MAANTKQKPRLLLLSLELQPWFDEMYKDCIDAFAEKATIQRVQKPEPATRVLGENPHIVLITDGALTKKSHRSTWDAVLRYVRGGGTAICMGHFSSFTLPLDFNPFFARAGLSWKKGDYQRTTVCINRGGVQSAIQPVLPESYSQKAVFLNNVDSAEAWYCSGEDSVVESRVFQPSKIAPGAVPVALASVGNGKFGYVGDVNNEVETKFVLLAMCGFHA